MATLTLTPATAKPDEPVFAKFTGAKPQRLVKFWQGPTLLGSDKSGKAGNANITFAARESGQITAKDNFGHSASATLTVTAVEPPPPVDQPPVISGIVVSGITQTGFTVAWHVSEKAQGWVEYGLNTMYGKDTTHETSFAYADHSQTVTGLQAGTTYHFRVHAVDQAGQHVTSPDQVALTSGGTVEPPPPPPPPPPTTTRPFPPPVTTQTVKMPTSIPTDGSRDVGTDIKNWLATVGNGSVVEYPAGTFKYPSLLLEGRRHLVLVGQGEGTKIILTGEGRNAPNGVQEAAFLLRNSQHIQIRDFDVTGGNRDRTNIYVPGRENQFILATSGWYGPPPCSYVEMTGITGRDIYTDVAYLEGEVVGAQRPADHVWIHHNKVAYVGRNHISSISINDLLVEDNEFDKVGGAPWDIEPNFAYEQVRRNTFRRNKIGSYGHMSQFAGWFVVAAYVEASPVEDIIVDDNDVVGIAASGNDGTPRGLNTKLVGKYTGGAFPRLTVRFTNNRTAQPAHGPVLYCGPGVGVAQSGNVQPLLSGSFSNCAP